MSNKFRSVALAVFALATLTAPAQAVPGRIGQGILQALPSGGHLADGAFTAAPNAFNAFCDGWSDQCATSGAPDLVVLDETRWNQLEMVNARVNRAIRPQADEAGTDVWTLGAAEGDCDDYAVEKRKELIDLGWPSAALSLSVAYIRSGEAHLLLTVRTDRGDFALDNLRARVVAADRTGYRWLARQSSIHPRLWVRVDGITPATTLVADASRSAHPIAASSERSIEVERPARMERTAKARPAARPIDVPVPAPAPAPVVVAEIASTPVVSPAQDEVEHFSQVSMSEMRAARAADFAVATIDRAPVPLLPIDFKAITALFDPVVVGTIPASAEARVRETSSID